MSKLSVLIPAYMYPKGVARILDSLLPLSNDVELIIGDDSKTDVVEDVVKQYSDPRIKYIRNQPGLGAAANWNDLLDRASGEFVILMHHDETPFSTDFLDRCVTLAKDAKTDVFVFDVVLVDGKLNAIRQHLPAMLRQVVFNRFPGYLFRRNAIGPTASLMVRRKIYPRFDQKLRWLIDVDLYFRLRNRSSNWRSVPSIVIGSVQGEHETITSELQSNIDTVRNNELSYLNEKHSGITIWLRAGSWNAALLSKIEAGLWSAFRLVSVGASLLINKIRIWR